MHVYNDDIHLNAITFELNQYTFQEHSVEAGNDVEEAPKRKRTERRSNGRQQDKVNRIH